MIKYMAYRVITIQGFPVNNISMEFLNNLIHLIHIVLALLVSPAELLLSLRVRSSVYPPVTHFTQKVVIGSSPNFTNGTRT